MRTPTARRRSRFPLSLLLAVWLLFFGAGCGERPDPTRLERARAAAGAAEASGAAEFAPEALAAAREALAVAEKEYDRQSGLRLIRSSKKAHAAADQAITYAAEAQTVGEAGTMLALETARSDLASAETAVIDLEGQIAQLVRCHRDGVRVSGVRELLASFKGVKESLGAATAQFDAREYTDASARVETLLVRTEQVSVEAREARHGSRCS